MNVHNIMEEYVKSRVDLMFDQLNENKPVWFTCSCEDCRLDAVNYVLNRTTPRYVVSGRGVVHNSEVLDNPQMRADVDALAIEGIRLINAVQRPYHKNIKQAGKNDIQQPSFNFPVFIGTVFDGTSFEPLSDAAITLKYGDMIVDMIDKTWPNPCRTYKATKGTYSFWAKPFRADKSGISRQFNFTVEVAVKEYSPVSYAFDIPVVSDSDSKTEMNTSYSVKIQDLFLFRSDVSNPMED
ncbi:MAG TPA: competence protein ComFB [Treponema sp.]|nr:competence protein ComFB [Treponema sp.]